MATDLHGWANNIESFIKSSPMRFMCKLSKSIAPRLPEKKMNEYQLAKKTCDVTVGESVKNYSRASGIQSERISKTYRHSAIDNLCHRTWQNQFRDRTCKNNSKSTQMSPCGIGFPWMEYWGCCIEKCDAGVPVSPKLPCWVRPCHLESPVTVCEHQQWLR